MVIRAESCAIFSSSSGVVTARKNIVGSRVCPPKRTDFQVIESEFQCIMGELLLRGGVSVDVKIAVMSTNSHEERISFGW